jgi:hypothetical protein
MTYRPRIHLQSWLVNLDRNLPGWSDVIDLLLLCGLGLANRRRPSFIKLR